MNHWRFWRLALLIGVGSATWVTLGRVALHPPGYKPLQLPPTLSLSGWRLSEAQILTGGGDASQPDAQMALGYYRYQKETTNQQTLKVKVHYIINTSGDVTDLMRRYAFLQLPVGQPNLTIRQQAGTGQYGLFVYQKQAHLSACINPRGGSTVTAKQFSQNRNTYDLTVSRLLPWLLGQADLRDWRCLWLHLSAPVESSPEATYQQLEVAWKALYPTWQAHFMSY